MVTRTTVVQQFIRGSGAVAQQHPLRVISDDGERLLGWIPVDTEIVASRLMDGREVRELPVEERAKQPRRRVKSLWRERSCLRLIDDREWSSVWWFFDRSGQFQFWYVNLEVPLDRTPQGPNRTDGTLDLVVTPNAEGKLRWEWKDEDEMLVAMKLGRFTQEQESRFRAEGERMISLVEERKFPFDGTWTTFRPEAHWPAPVLPAELFDGLETFH